MTVVDHAVRVRSRGRGPSAAGSGEGGLGMPRIAGPVADGPDGARAARPGVPGGTASRGAPLGRAVMMPSWPLLLLAVPAAVAVWSGWVGIGQMTGFGQVHPLPGIWESLHLNTAVTLPVGVEAYAAYALRAWLSAGTTVSVQTRRFARGSAIGSLLLGMAGQVAYHLLAQDRATHAPWEITTAVSCLPVLVLGMGAALAHMLRSDAHDLGRSGQPGDQSQDQSAVSRDLGAAGPARSVPVISCDRLAEAEAAAGRLVAAGERISRRALRRVGVHGSNADLGVLARAVRYGMAPAESQRAG